MLACFILMKFSTDAQVLLEMINNRDKEDDWDNIYPKLETAKEALREVFNELWAEKERGQK